MSRYENFALAGAGGTVGKAIVEDLIKKKDAGAISSVTVLTRSVGKHKNLAEKGAKIITVDYTSSASLESALTDIDVIISVLGVSGIGLQDALATSAKATGVKLFVTSDFGSEPHDQTNNPLFKQKENVKLRLKELQLPYAVFYTGLFTEKALFPIYSAVLGLNFASREFSIPGSGTAPISWTTTQETAQFIVHVLTAFPREKIEWRIFRIEGDRMSFNDIVAAWAKYTGKPVTISHHARSNFEEALKENPADHLSLFILQLDSGNLVVGDLSELSNAEYPEWKPKKVIDVLAEIYG